MTPLIDATEMYLRTIWELEEEGILPIRARLVERLNLSAPAVSETVARLEQEGLVRVGADRTLELTDAGRHLAISVMRKHRLAELLLTDVIGLEWEQVHGEACRWEHVISDTVEQRLIELLEEPQVCPHGNPIPGLGESLDRAALSTLSEAADRGGTVVVRRISEKLQGDVGVMRQLRQHALQPGTTVTATRSGDHVVVDGTGASLRLPEADAELIYVSAG